MSRQIALLRGINVGGHNSFPKAQQLALAEPLGLKDVSVLLQTGNLVFADPGTPPEEICLLYTVYKRQPRPCT